MNKPTDREWNHILYSLWIRSKKLSVHLHSRLQECRSAGKVSALKRISKLIPFWSIGAHAVTPTADFQRLRAEALDRNGDATEPLAGARS